MNAEYTTSCSHNPGDALIPRSQKTLPPIFCQPTVILTKVFLFSMRNPNESRQTKQCVYKTSKQRTSSHIAQKLFVHREWCPDFRSPTQSPNGPCVHGNISPCPSQDSAAIPRMDSKRFWLPPHPTYQLPQAPPICSELRDHRHYPSRWWVYNQA